MNPNSIKATLKKKAKPCRCRMFANDVGFFNQWRANIEDAPEAFAVRSIITNKFAVNKAWREITGQVSPMLPWGDAVGRLCAGELRRVEDAHSRCMKTGESVDFSYWMRLGVAYEPTEVLEVANYDRCKCCGQAVLLLQIAPCP